MPKTGVVITFSLPPEWYAILAELHRAQAQAFPGERSIHQTARDLLLPALAAQAQARRWEHPAVPVASGARRPRRGGQPPLAAQAPSAGPPLPSRNAVPGPRETRRPRKPKAPPSPAAPPLATPAPLTTLRPSDLLERLDSHAGSTPEGVQAVLASVLGPGALARPQTPPGASQEGSWSDQPSATKAEPK